MTWPLEPVGIARLRARPGRHRRGRGEARLHRAADEGAVLQLAGQRGRARPSSASTTKPASGSCRRTNELTPGAHRRRDRQAPASASSPREHIEQRLRWMDEKEAELALPRANFPRVPHYCSAARTTPRPWCRKARARWAASAATTWSRGWTATPTPSPTWAAKA